jgi:uncharacterized protein YdhG (YjbR/CyaY superfamily)
MAQTQTGLSDAEKAAARARVKELKADAKRGADREAGLKDLLDKIAEMPPSDRGLAERIHSIVSEAAPELFPRTWYGMPAYSRDGKLICFFKAADKFKQRYATFGFEDAAQLDEGSVWPTVWAVTRLTAADEAKIAELVKKAVS